LYSTTADLYEWCRVAEASKFFNVHDAARAYGWGVRETKTKHKYIEQKRAGSRLLLAHRSRSR